MRHADYIHQNCNRHNYKDIKNYPDNKCSACKVNCWFLRYASETTRDRYFYCKYCEYNQTSIKCVRSYELLNKYKECFNKENIDVQQKKDFRGQQPNHILIQFHWKTELTFLRSFYYFDNLSLDWFSFILLIKLGVLLKRIHRRICHLITWRSMLSINQHLF